jgi:4-amino-4-deoxy-L-arabinose transferase-like glycosyltransferase
MWRLVWLGVACGLGALARTELLLAVPLLLVPLVLVVRGVGWQRKIVWMVAGGVAALIVIAPWVGYNMTRFNAPVTISTNAGGTLAAANCRSTYYGELIGYKDYGCALRVWIAASKREPNWKHFDEAQKDRAVQAESKRYIDAHLTRLPVVVAARWGRILSVYQPFQEVRFDKFVLKQEWSVGYSIVWTFWLFTLLAAAGVAVLHRRKVPVWPLLAFPVIVFISVGLTFAQTRYRVPAEVAMVLLAAVAVDAGFARFRSRRAVETDERGETSVLDLTALEAPDPEVAASAGSPTADRR